ncbi:hypothetical protein AOG54_03605 [Acidiplasma aeolicum]|uniref:Uncharacterized protein n=5 Tax=Acidiplasma aeolicum TaxID=507754 RepID=A0A0Q0WH34_9ARCH|nr:hypothetical protein AOG54_03605 [Acidiplasma aeolicum]
MWISNIKIMVYEIITLIIYFAILFIFLLYIRTRMKNLLKLMDKEKNLTDLLFLKRLLNFLYKNNLIKNLEIFLEKLSTSNDSNVLEIFKDMIPEAENDIINIYKPLNRFVELKKKYDMINENYVWLFYFSVAYSIILIIIFLINFFKLKIILNIYFSSILFWAILIMAVITSIAMAVHTLKLIMGTLNEIGSV